ncbi:MAG: transcription antitermination factor NusB [Candidatus Omnitrophota bacterium]|jgi:transcription antitermination factor NusB|nr:transcription antitermination factor NusB [Candidatus Omnitrophota bacterium]
MRNRTLARECALKILYQADVTRREIKAAAQNFWEEAPKEDQPVKEFCSRITSGVAEHLPFIDEKITFYATNWQLKRMAVIDRNVLRIGVYELLFSADVPPKVSINEAIELAKKYGDMDSNKFVNGILDKLHKTEVNPPKPQS